MNAIHVVDTITSIHPGSCNGYTNLTDPWRNRAYTRSDVDGFPKNDILLHNKWWRFTGIGGDRALTSCNSNMGGFQYPWRVEVTYPDIESLNPTKGYTLTAINGCGTQGITIDFVFCPGGFYVFKPLDVGPSYSGFATCENAFKIYFTPSLYTHRSKHILRFELI